MAEHEENDSTSTRGNDVTDAHRHGPHWSAWIRNTLLGLVIRLMLWLVFNVRLPSLDELQSQLE